jgi:hypothetical protein
MSATGSTAIDPQWYKKIWMWTARMRYVGHTFRYGEVLVPPEDKAGTSTRLYTLDELREIFAARGMQVQAAFGDYDPGVPASDDRLSLLVYSEKL